MCGEAYGIPRLGDEKDAEKLSLQKLYAQYGELIASSRLELIYCGSAGGNGVEQALAGGVCNAAPGERSGDRPGAPHAAPVRSRCG